MEAKGLDPKDMVLSKAMTYRVLMALQAQHLRGRVIDTRTAQVRHADLGAARMM